jgi:hypothetical protein
MKYSGTLNISSQRERILVSETIHLHKVVSNADTQVQALQDEQVANSEAFQTINTQSMSVDIHGIRLTPTNQLNQETL